MPAPYKVEDLVPQREGQNNQTGVGPILQSMPKGGGSAPQGQPQGAQPQGGGSAPGAASAPQGGQQGGDPGLIQQAASGWNNFFGYLRENPEAVAFLANASQALLDPNAANDPGAALRAGFQGMANYRTLYNELLKQQRGEAREDRLAELEATRVDLLGEQLEQRDRHHKTETRLTERGLELEELGLLIKDKALRQKLQEKQELDPKEVEQLYTSVYERQIETLKAKKNSAEPLTEDDIIQARVAANAAIPKEEWRQYDTNWTEDMLKNMARGAVAAGQVPMVKNTVRWQFGPEAAEKLSKYLAEAIRARARGEPVAAEQQGGPQGGPQNPQVTPEMESTMRNLANIPM